MTPTADVHDEHIHSFPHCPLPCACSGQLCLLLTPGAAELACQAGASKVIEACLLRKEVQHNARQVQHAEADVSGEAWAGLVESLLGVDALGAVVAAAGNDPPEEEFTALLLSLCCNQYANHVVQTALCVASNPQHGRVLHMLAPHAAWLADQAYGRHVASKLVPRRTLQRGRCRMPHAAQSAQ